ncbi:MAG: hypothetical protein KC516_03385 [Nanoarchaeota archaeon]|nr:hypothetical protein [Nanoarchaeota archaeon]
MAKKVREITIRESKGTFSVFSKTGVSKENYNFDGISALRNLLSNEKARILDTIKNKEPTSMYQLAKMLDRPFKAVFDDVKTLKRFGFIDLVKENVIGRTRYKPVIEVDEILVYFKI